MSGTKNLGLVKAIHVGNSAPANTNMIWRNTLDNLHYYHNGFNWVQLAGGGGTPGLQMDAQFIFQPGGVRSGIVYDDFEEMMDAIDLWPGMAQILFDRSLLAPATPITIPARSGGGEWDFTDCTMGFVFSSVYDGSLNISIDVADGNRWRRFPQSISFCSLNFKNTSFPVYESGIGTIAIHYIEGSTEIINTGTYPVIKIDSSSGVILAMSDGTKLGEVSSYECVDVVNNSTFQFVSLGSAIMRASSIRGDATATLDVNLESTEGEYEALQPNFAGTVDLNNNNSSRTMFGFLSNLGSYSFNHNFMQENVFVQFFDNTALPYRMLAPGIDIQVEILGSSTVRITDLIGLGGINVRMHLQTFVNQIQ